MADVNRGSRPLSPHLQVYRWQITMLTSILHRVTGVALTLGAVLVVWWFAAAAISPEAHATADAVLTSWIGILVLIGSLWALWYHLLNGVRHLVWDAGYGFGLDIMAKTGWAAVIGSVLLTLVTLLIVL